MKEEKTKPAVVRMAAATSGEGKLICPQCPDSVEFTNKFWLSKHMSNVHGIQLDHRCTDCNASFQTPTGLAGHVSKAQWIVF